MNRNDVIDVLSVIAAATRRTVGETDVQIWEPIIGSLPKDLALQAVRDFLRDRPGVWLEPGHVVQGARAIKRDRLEREPDSAREARQDALVAKLKEDAAVFAARTAIPAQEFKRPNLNFLTVKCPWCKAGVGQQCTIPGTNQKLRQGLRVHPARREAAATADAGKAQA